MENKIIEANISFEPWKIKKTPVIIGVILSCLLYITSSTIIEVKQGKYEYNKEIKYYEEGFNIFGECIEYSYGHGHMDIGFHEPSLSIGGIVAIVSLAIIITVVLLIMITSAIVNDSANRCTLYLNDKGISGVKKTGFFSKSILLPMDKIDSITVQNGIFDKIFGGQTVAIRSASGLIKFPWVQNAQEFVDTTLAEIQKYNESVELRSKPAPTLSPSSSASLTEKLQELQSLKDQGILTEEQFEAKKQQLLANF